MLDETHDPGGSVSYVGELFDLLIGSTKNAWGQRNHADRQWLAAYLDGADGLRARGATDRSLTTEPNAAFHGSKPLIVLADELSAFGGDALPMLIKANHIR